MADLFQQTQDNMSEETIETVEMLSARSAVLDIIGLILDKKQPLDQCLERHSDFIQLSTRDKAFARMLTSTILRRLGQIDDVISKLEDRPGQSKNAALHNILRIGIAQIFFMNVPDHAAVDTAVKLAEKNRLGKQKGFINAILRNAIRQGQDIISKQDPARLNAPEWLLKIWIEDYGMGRAAKISQANMNEAPLDITVKDQDSKNYWSSLLQATNFPSGSLRIVTHSGAVHAMQGYEDGMWWVQDASASIPAQLFGNVENKTVVDFCAAPGGKTVQLAANGANVIAIDRSATRLQKLRENLKRLRLGENVEILTEDASHWKPKKPVDMVLLDAPCSATGTIRRNPDILHLKSEHDVSSLVETQKKLLENAFRVLAPGGILIYCTCSLQKIEGEYQLSRFFEAHKNAKHLPIDAEEIGEMSEILNDNGDIRILPFHHGSTGGMDGFFISRLTKTEA